MDPITTVNHQEIKEWAVKRGGQPQLIDDPKATGDVAGIRISFPGYDDDRYMPANEVRNISWDDFFRYFEKMKLAFMYEPDQSQNEATPTYYFIKRQELKPEVAKQEHAMIEKRAEVTEYLKRDE